MTSLRGHLRQAGSHGSLLFHPDCPVCRRERLAGHLHPQAIAAPRTLAALTAGLLAVSGTGPPLAAAAPDIDQPGSAAPDTKQTDPAHQPDSNPGGQTTTASEITVQPDASTGGGVDSDSPDPEPAKDPIPTSDPSDRTPDPGPSQPGRAPATPTTAPSPAAVPTSSAVAVPHAPTPQITVVAPPRPAIEVAGHRNHHGRQRSPGNEVVYQPSMSPLPAGTPRDLAPSDRPAADVTAAPSATRRAGHHGRVHVVIRGESLWTIARDELPDGATNVDIAREVHRLWEFNKATVATGTPDLLPVGTKLSLS